MAFQPKHLNYERSPYTGMTREDWKDAAVYMLSGIFQYIDDMEHPVVVPRQETKITYPHAESAPGVYEAEKKAEIFEGLTRSLFIAAPLIHENPELTLNGINIREYYKHHILRCCTRGDDYCVGTYEDLQELTNHADPFRAFQQTVETCALVIGLMTAKEELWDGYTKEEQDIVAGLIGSFAGRNTVPQNWRMFNMLDMAFLYQVGYEIDEAVMLDHAQAALDYYVGDGWYRDGQNFDYYSCWAFNFYAPLWNQWYGYEKLPFIAEQFEKNSNELMKTYPDFFDRDGHTNMWGRSCIYRFAAVSPFDGNYYLKHPEVDPGVARRICSGSLLQFLARDDFMWNGLPTMGFYGQFSPLVQGYSCAESVFWMGKAFLCLHLPKDHPFWTAKEALGTWEKLEKNEVKETVLDGPALAFTNHQANGTTVLRTGKVVKNERDVHGMWNYSKLNYNTKYPWEATPKPMDEAGNLLFAAGGVESQQYVIKDVTSGETSLANSTFWGGEREGILYRCQYFRYATTNELHWMQSIYLADFPVACGILRVDKLKLHRRPIVLTLGSYGFPDNGTQVEMRTKNGAKAVILKGTDAMGRKKQMAMTVFAGWEDLEVLHSEGTNPDSVKSIVIYAKTGLKHQYDGTEAYVFISQVLTKEEHTEFTEEELFPITEITYTDAAQCGTYGPVTLRMTDGSTKTVDYSKLTGSMML